MAKLSLYVPSIEDYWYEEHVQSDPLTMSYNAGYDVSYFGYHYDTGCIDFPKERWEETYKKRQANNRYFAYLRDESTNEFVGYINYHFNSSDNRYDCGVVIEAKYRGNHYGKEALGLLCNKAKENGVKELYDNFEVDRVNAINLFTSMGFKVVKEETYIKFKKPIKGVLVKKIL